MVLKERPLAYPPHQVATSVAEKVGVEVTKINTGERVPRHNVLRVT